MQIYPEAEPFTHLAKVPFGVKQYTFYHWHKTIQRLIT